MFMGLTSNWETTTKSLKFVKRVYIKIGCNFLFVVVIFCILKIFSFNDKITKGNRRC